MGEGVGVALSFCPNAEVLDAARTREAASAAIKQLRVNVVGDSMPAPFLLFTFSVFQRSLHDDSAVGMQNRSGVVAALFAGEEQRGVGDIDWLPPPIPRAAPAHGGKV